MARKTNVSMLFGPPCRVIFYSTNDSITPPPTQPENGSIQLKTQTTFQELIRFNSPTESAFENIDSNQPRTQEVIRFESTLESTHHTIDCRADHCIDTDSTGYTSITRIPGPTKFGMQVIHGAAHCIRLREGRHSRDEISYPWAVIY